MIPNHNFSSSTPVTVPLMSWPAEESLQLVPEQQHQRRRVSWDPSRNTTIPQSKLSANASLRVSRPLWSEVFLSNFRPDVNELLCCLPYQTCKPDAGEQVCGAIKLEDPLIHFRCVEEGNNIFYQVRKGKSGP